MTFGEIESLKVRKAMRELDRVGEDQLEAQRAAALRAAAGARTCLMCGRSFKSDGPWNRRCGRCVFARRESIASEAAMGAVWRRQVRDRRPVQAGR